MDVVQMGKKDENGDLVIVHLFHMLTANTIYV